MLADKTQRTLAQELAGLKKTVKSVSAWHTTLEGFFKRKDRVFVVTTQVSTVVVRSPQGEALSFKETSSSVDTWLVSGADLKLARSQDLRDDTKPTP